MLYKESFIETLTILDSLGLLEHVILIGSWAEYLYEQCNVVESFISTTKTMDIDFLVKNIRKPREKIALVDAFQEKGYDLAFRHNGVVTLVKDEFEVEFLAKQIGKPIPVVDSLNFGKLETLGHMSVIEKNIITVGYEGVPVSIPNPAAFALQKMVINKDRKAKQMKDAEAVKNLVYALEGCRDDKGFS
ncbi:GSU2403 family nucleotidyltransferase fold protein [Acetobacterium sp.]|uniref:GSU2403 family nucleotidyltransferase fold protein n=1 Tax=Acetobacterium sp. TaxID=1872094 RepID=UPI002F3F1DAE